MITQAIQLAHVLLLINKVTVIDIFKEKKYPRAWIAKGKLEAGTKRGALTSFLTQQQVNEKTRAGQEPCQIPKQPASMYTHTSLASLWETEG